MLPDLPMMIFYFVEKVIRGTAEAAIWGQVYHRDSWQAFFDVFNSLPLIGIGWLVSLWARTRLGALVFASMALHVAFDFPVHREDAHRHFFPLSDWRFTSPVSYWDPNHYGDIFAPVEALAVVVGCVVLFRGYEARAGKAVVGLIGGSYLAYLGYVLLVWA